MNFHPEKGSRGQRRKEAIHEEYFHQEAALNASKEDRSIEKDITKEELDADLRELLEYRKDPNDYGRLIGKGAMDIAHNGRMSQESRRLLRKYSEADLRFRLGKSPSPLNSAEHNSQLVIDPALAMFMQKYIPWVDDPEYPSKPFVLSNIIATDDKIVRKLEIAGIDVARDGAGVKECRLMHSMDESAAQYMQEQGVSLPELAKMSDDRENVFSTLVSQMEKQGYYHGMITAEQLKNLWPEDLLATMKGLTLLDKIGLFNAISLAAEHLYVVEKDKMELLGGFTKGRSHPMKVDFTLTDEQKEWIKACGGQITPALFSKMTKIPENAVTQKDISLLLASWLDSSDIPRFFESQGQTGPAFVMPQRHSFSSCEKLEGRLRHEVYTGKAGWLDMQINGHSVRCVAKYEEVPTLICLESDHPDFRVGMSYVRCGIPTLGLLYSIQRRHVSLNEAELRAQLPGGLLLAASRTVPQGLIKECLEFSRNQIAQ